MVLLSCHIPFIFYAGKEGLLIIIDELDRKSISSALWHKLYATNETFEKQNSEELPPNPLLPIPGMTMPFLTLEGLMSKQEVQNQRETTLLSARTRMSMVTTE
jgi:hypothetical protein